MFILDIVQRYCGAPKVIFAFAVSHHVVHDMTLASRLESNHSLVVVAPTADARATYLFLVPQSWVS
jgi:hypothetical protein